MAEFYVNGIMSHPYTFDYSLNEGALMLGTLDVSGGAVVSDTAAWRMTLPAV
jgi:hypothetical protein